MLHDPRKKREQKSCQIFAGKGRIAWQNPFCNMLMTMRTSIGRGEEKCLSCERNQKNFRYWGFAIKIEQISHTNVDVLKE